MLFFCLYLPKSLSSGSNVNNDLLIVERSNELLNVNDQFRPGSIVDCHVCFRFGDQSVIFKGS